MPISYRCRSDSIILANEIKLFDLVCHYNVGLNLVLQSDNEQRIVVAQLNLLAARKAKLAASYTAALEYCKAGMLLMGFAPLLSTSGSSLNSSKMNPPTPPVNSGADANSAAGSSQEAKQDKEEKKKEEKKTEKKPRDKDHKRSHSPRARWWW